MLLCVTGCILTLAEAIIRQRTRQLPAAALLSGPSLSLLAALGATFPRSAPPLTATRLHFMDVLQCTL